MCECISKRTDNRSSGLRLANMACGRPWWHQCAFQLPQLDIMWMLIQCGPSVVLSPPVTLPLTEHPALLPAGEGVGGLWRFDVNDSTLYAKVSLYSLHPGASCIHLPTTLMKTMHHYIHLHLLFVNEHYYI